MGFWLCMLCHFWNISFILENLMCKFNCLQTSLVSSTLHSWLSRYIIIHTTQVKLAKDACGVAGAHARADLWVHVTLHQLISHISDCCTTAQKVKMEGCLQQSNELLVEVRGCEAKMVICLMTGWSAWELEGKHTTILFLNGQTSADY